MKHGFIKVAALTPQIKVADPNYNKVQICALIDQACEADVKVMVFPELCITGASCGELFLQELLLEEAKQALIEIASHTDQIDAIVFVGLPIAHNGKLYNVAAAINRGTIMALVPKTCVTQYFCPGMEKVIPIRLDDDNIVPMGTQLLFSCRQVQGLRIGVEFGDDLMAPIQPGAGAATAGATMIVNLAATTEMVGSDAYRRMVILTQSKRLHCGYVYCGSGDGESTQSGVYAAHNLIAENGELLEEADRFANDSIISEIDVSRLLKERFGSAMFAPSEEVYINSEFVLSEEQTMLTRKVAESPFVPEAKAERDKRVADVAMIQAMGLKKRLESLNKKQAIVPAEGSLNDILAILTAVKAYDLLGLNRADLTVAIPSKQEVSDVIPTLAMQLQVTLKEDKDVKVGEGLVIGSDDMTMLALGLGGVKPCMYAVNASIPQSLIRHLIRYHADTCGNIGLMKCLMEILNIPVALDDEELAAGPFELHEFFLYYMLRYGCAPQKIFRLALQAFGEKYATETIKQWLVTFYHRFFASAWMRNALADAPVVGSVSLKGGNGIQIPSDACERIWIGELEELVEEDVIAPVRKEYKSTPASDSILDLDWESFAQAFM